LTVSGSYEGVSLSNVVSIFSINTNTTNLVHNPFGNNKLNIVHYGSSLPGGSPAGSFAPGNFAAYVGLSTNNNATNYGLSLTIKIESLDANNNVIGIINNTSWLKDDCDD
jgi:hypothetical protein